LPGGFDPTRSSLLGRLKDWEDQESWRDFFETYWRLIYSFALHRGLNHEEAQEVVQETVVAVAKSIGALRYDRRSCSFKTWLLTVTLSKIANQYARRARQLSFAGESPPEDAAGTDWLDRVSDEKGSPWEEIWDEEWRSNIMECAIRRVKNRVPIEQYQMFDLFVNKQMTARDVAATLNVSVGHVYVAKHRVSKLICKELQTLERQEI